MDGNGRWAQEKGNDRLFGHQHGVISVREVTEAAAELQMQYLTLYAFSTENWNRPKEEVEGLMTLLVDTIEGETPTLTKNNVRLLVIGDLDSLPEAVRLRLEKCIEQTSQNTGLALVLALSYSSRWEIAQAMRQIAPLLQAGTLAPEDITEEVISKNLTTQHIPDPELLIRTSGEIRLSNFLLWQLAYTELYFTQVNWPDFRKEDFFKALLEYQQRERRFGMTSAQVSK